MPETSYTLHLILLECHQEQESDGDEPYLKVNGSVCFEWEKINKRFKSDLTSERWTDAFDFRTGKVRTLRGWEATKVYLADDFIFPNLTGETTIELWESDEGEWLRGEDDFLGEALVNARQISHLEHEHLFDMHNAVYRLVYRVSATV